MMAIGEKLRLLRQKKEIGAVQSRNILIDVDVSRHDHDSIDLKSAFELEADEAEGRVEIALFVPQSLRMSAFGKSKIVSDFQSRIRLSFSSDELDDLGRIESTLLQINNSIKEADIRFLGARVGELLKKRSAFFRETFRKIGNRSGSFRRRELSRLSQCLDVLEENEDLLKRVRKISKENAPEIKLIDTLIEYLDHHYIEFLGNARKCVEVAKKARLETLSESNLKTLEEVFLLLADVQRKEASRRTFDLSVSSEADIERHLVRVSQMKKYFQSDLYFDVTQSEILKKISEPTAAIGAMMAAGVAAGLQHMSDPMVLQVGYQGAAVIFLGIAFYVLRDRLKDKAKIILREKVSSYVPDIEKNLMVGDRIVGRLRESFSVLKNSNVDWKLRKLRDRAAISEVDHEIPEDVFVYRRVYKLNKANVNKSAGNLSIQEVLRINVERYLKFMDDPFKSVQLLGGDGCMKEVASARVYYFYLVVRSSFSKKTSKRFKRVYRIVVSKTGIARVEDLKAGG